MLTFCTTRIPVKMLSNSGRLSGRREGSEETHDSVHEEEASGAAKTA